MEQSTIPTVPRLPPITQQNGNTCTPESSRTTSPAILGKNSSRESIASQQPYTGDEHAATTRGDLGLRLRWSDSRINMKAGNHGSRPFEDTVALKVSRSTPACVGLPAISPTQQQESSRSVSRLLSGDSQTDSSCQETVDWGSIQGTSNQVNFHRPRSGDSTKPQTGSSCHVTEVWDGEFDPEAIKYFRSLTPVEIEWKPPVVNEESSPVLDAESQSSTVTNGESQSSPVPNDVYQSSPVPNGVYQSSPVPNDVYQSNPVSNGESQSSPVSNGESQSSPVSDAEPQSSPVPNDESQSSPVLNGESQSSPFLDAASQSSPVSNNESDLASIYLPSVERQPRELTPFPNIEWDSEYQDRYKEKVTTQPESTEEQVEPGSKSETEKFASSKSNNYSTFAAQNGGVKVEDEAETNEPTEEVARQPSTEMSEAKKALNIELEAVWNKYDYQQNRYYEMMAKVHTEHEKANEWRLNALQYKLSYTMLKAELDEKREETGVVGCYGEM